MQTRTRIATGEVITFPFPGFEKPGCDYENIRAKFYTKASAQPAANEDKPITVFGTVQLYEKCLPEQDLVFFIQVFHKYRNIRKALMEVDATASPIIRNKCALYGITDTIGTAEDMTLSRIIRAFPVHTAKVILKEQFQGILPYSSFFQQDLPLLMQHNIFSGLLPRFDFPELRQVSEVLIMEISVKLARPAEKQDFMKKSVNDFIKYSRKHVEAYLFSRLDDENSKMKILIEAGIVEFKANELELTAATVALVNKLKYIEAVYSLKYSEALDKLKGK